MIEIKNPADCCGCTACASICNHDAITMKPDALGFLYPEVDKVNCVDCGLCEKVCPIQSRKEIDKTKETPLQYKAIRIKDEDVLEVSSSGGAFSMLANIIFGIGGVVCGVEYTENGMARHTIIERKNDLYKLRGSKYVQSDILGIFQEVKNRLKRGQYLLFSGTPCQIDGLKHFLRKEYSNLLTVDLVCHSIPSPMVYKDYMSYCSKVLGHEIKSIDMRYKNTYGWSHRYSYRFNFKNGKSTVDPPYVVNWGKIFFSDMINRPSCGDCQYTNLNRVGDFTIADFWDDNRKRPDIYSKKGTSLLLINSEKAQQILNENPGGLYSWDITKEEALQPSLCHVTKQNEKQDDFLNDYFNKGFEYAYKTYFADSNYQIMKNLIKKIIRKWQNH